MNHRQLLLLLVVVVVMEVCRLQTACCKQVTCLPLNQVSERNGKKKGEMKREQIKKVTKKREREKRVKVEMESD